ncbi:copper resistance CopC/CopD family protein [Streptomyces microflavus]|uniref:copper resistance CopC/CopD family protein n=1 Tax=Streptomyces microflavus TaxID=1919 RepID=UPI003683A6D2
MTITAPRRRPWVIALLAGVGLLLGGASPAAAHAVLTDSAPTRGAVVAEPPSQVDLEFSEAVSVSPDAIRVLDPSGRRVDDGRPSAKGDGSYAVGLSDATARGTYTVTYQVESADSHPVGGAFTFSVGEPSATSVVPTVRDPDTGWVGRSYTAARFGAYTGMIIMTGGILMLLLCLPRGEEHPAVRRPTAWAWGLLWVCTLALLLLRGAYVSSGRVADITDVARLADTVRTKAGGLLALRLALLTCCAVLWRYRRRGRQAPPGRHRPSRGLLAGTALVGMGLAWTWAGAEHASTGPQPYLAMPVDAVHLVAAGAWVGGLLVLAGALIRAGDEVPTEAVTRFSRIAFISVCVLALTGLYQSWRQVGSLSALVDTRFGQLLLLKAAGVGLLLCLGQVSRRWTKRLARPQADGGRAPLRALRRWVSAEAVVGLCVIAATTALAATQPARTPSAAVAHEGTSATVSLEADFDTGGPKGEGSADIVVDPGRRGPNAVHVTLTAQDGTPLDAPEIQASLTSRSGSIGPLPVPVERVSAGHWSVSGFQVPVAGSWDLSLTVRTSDFDQATVRESFEIP